MKKTLSFLLFFVVLAFSQSYCQNYFSRTDYDESKTRIVAVHPTVWNLQTLIFLKDNKLLDIPDLEIVGVYYQKEEYNFSQSVQFVKSAGYDYIHLHKIDSGLNRSNLFKKNPCSDDFHTIFEHSDGIIFFGGPDFPPGIYGKKTHLLTNITNPERHYFEMSFLFHLLGGSQNENFTPYLEENPDYSVLGFCLGMQTMNVATGGTMHQDIPTSIYQMPYIEDILAMDSDLRHRNYWRNISIDNELTWGNFHHIKIMEDKFFATKMNVSKDETPLVYSSHHQAVNKIGKGFEIVATSMDGKVVEALAHTKYPNVFGVQFHPEVKALYSDEYKYKLTPDDEKAVSYKEVIEKDGKKFHEKFWTFYSEMFK